MNTEHKPSACESTWTQRQT